MRGVLAILVIAMGLTACGRKDERILFDGHYFDARVSTDRSDRQKVTTTARPVSNSLEGALAAARHEAIRYCISNYGNSAIDWVVGPDQDVESYVIVNDTIELSGACEG